MRSADFFIETPASSPWGSTDSSTIELDEKLVTALRSGPINGENDVSACQGLLDLVHDELQAYGTSGGHRLTDEQMRLAIRTLEAVTQRLGIRLQVPFQDFTSFRSYWSRNGARNSWQARRDILEKLFEPARAKLAGLEGPTVGSRLPEQSLAHLQDPAAIQEQLWRIQRAIMDDPALAVGSAKELIESTAKVVLIERGLMIDDKADLPALVKDAQIALRLHPTSKAPGPDGSDAVKRILGSVSSVAIGVAELRNRGYGTGHGPAAARVGLRPRHAHLAVNAAVTWCQLMLDTLADTEAPWHNDV
ncbi:abortive infection family protein [Sphaerisporangium sp. NPDC005288]|uniref:abortive infection family protein n=1 Tax=Sphaerisporangium sp. NPDC005288 TaxID=3155114 RepID=UPI0033A35B09